MKFKLVICCIVSTLFLTDCGREKSNSIPDEFVDLVLEFIEAGKKRGINLTYDELGLVISLEEELETPNMIGYCKNRRNSKTVVLSKTYWQDPRTTLEDKKVLLFHELGHCLLDRGHDDGTVLPGICSSVMRAGDADCVHILRSSMWWEYHLDELFGYRDADEFRTEIYRDTSTAVLEQLPYFYSIDTLADYYASTVPISKNDLGDTFAIKVRFDDWRDASRRVLVEIMGYDLLYCDCVQAPFKVNASNNLRYQSPNTARVEGTVEFLILSSNDKLKFYLNGSYMLTIEDVANNPLLEFRTNRFDSPVSMSMQILSN